MSTGITFLPGPEDELRLYLGSRGATELLAAALARLLPPVCGVGLSGPLGAGKTELVRAFLRTFDPGLHVPSPTFVLEQVYDFPGQRLPRISHWDFYRLQSGDPPEEVLDALSADQVVLIEWPERFADVVRRLDFQLVLSHLDQPDPAAPALLTEAEGAENRAAGNERCCSVLSREKSFPGRLREDLLRAGAISAR